jgi:signal transduction histidine kinase
MNSRQIMFVNTMERLTKIDYQDLAQTFREATNAQVTNQIVSLLIGAVAVVLLIIFSVWMLSSIDRSLKGLSSGITRFANGDFSQQISITNQDELGDLSQKANLMAEKIVSLMKELESFSYSVAHDLRAPLRSMLGFSQMVLENHGASLDSDGQDMLRRVVGAAKKMGHLIDSLLSLSRISRKDVVKSRVDLAQIADNVISSLRADFPGREIQVEVRRPLHVSGDPNLMSVVLTNLIGNAWKFTSKTDSPRIQVGALNANGRNSFYVRDNGAGFNMLHGDKLFGTFQRLHGESDFPGHGIGLAMVQNIINRHGGRIWAEGEPGKGATFYFTLP